MVQSNFLNIHKYLKFFNSEAQVPLKSMEKATKDAKLSWKDLGNLVDEMIGPNNSHF